MIPKQLDVAARAVLAVAVICGSMVPPAAARAEEVSPGGSDDKVVRPVAGTGTTDAAVRPRISRMTHDWTGFRQEEFRLEILFSQEVTGFTVDDVQVFGATKDGNSFTPTTGPARRYFVTMNTWPNHEAQVIVTINGNVAHNDDGEGNNGDVYTFHADTRAPRHLNAEVDGRELTVTFSEDLDESTVPPTRNFDVFVTRNGGRDVERVSGVVVDGSAVILTLARAVRAGDDVELDYDADAGTRALRDEAGNLAPDIGALSVVNETAEGEVPGRPRNLTATASGATAIDLDWDEPLDRGSSAIIGYLIEVSTDGGATWSNRVSNTRSTATRYRHTGLTAGSTRHYRISAINSYDTGAPSGVARATTEEEERVPDAPSRLTAAPGGTSTIELSWTAPSSSGSAPITGYRIEWSETGIGTRGWTLLVGNHRATSYTHTRLSPGTTRHYRVAAINTAGTGPWCYRARQITGSWALKMSGLSPVAGVRPWDVGRRRARAENGLATIASPLNEGDVMIGRETRVLLRHYLEQGLSKAAVARRCGVSERTVYRWIAAGQLDRELDDGPVRYGPRRPRPSRLDPYKEIIETRLARYPDLSAVRLFEEIRKAGYEGGYDQVKRHVREVRPLPEPEPVRRFETPPGHQGQVDFAEFKTPWGKRHALVVVLGYSRLMWVRYYERQTMAVVMEGLESAFRYFGGVPSELLFDQMKAVIVEDNREVGGRLMENTEFLRFAHHWGFRIRACRPYRAQTKGKVERPVSYIRRSFFYGRDFVSDDDLNARVLGWLGRVANVRVHGTLKERPVDRFEAERPHLKPLARWPYRPVTPLRPEPSKERNEAAADSRFVEVERRPLAEYGRIAGGVR